MTYIACDHRYLQIDAPGEIFRCTKCGALRPEAADHARQIRDNLRAAVDVGKGVRVTTRRGQVFEVAAEQVSIARASTTLGFSGRFAYGGIESVVAIDSIIL